MTFSVQPDGLGARLKAERVRLGLSQEQVCELTDITRGSLSRYERNVLLPGVDYLLRLQDLKFDVLYILYGKRANSILELTAPLLFNEAIDFVDRLAARHDFNPPPEFRVKAIVWAYHWLSGRRDDPTQLPTFQDLLSCVGANEQ